MMWNDCCMSHLKKMVTHSKLSGSTVRPCLRSSTTFLGNIWLTSCSVLAFSTCSSFVLSATMASKLLEYFSSWNTQGWLVGFYGTAALYRLYSAGECSECENECACRDGGVVSPCTLEQWVNSPPPIPLGVCAEFDGGQTILHSRAVGIFYPPP